MKFIITLFLCIPFYISAQNVLFEKQIKTDLQKPISNAIQNYVQYIKTKDEQIVRLDKDGISLYSNNMDRIWRVELEQVKSVGNENYFYCSPQDDYIYLAQYGTAFSNDNCINILHQFSYETGLHTTRNLNEIIPFRAVSNIETIADKVFVFGVGTKGVFTPYGNKFVAFQPIIVLNQDLEILDTSNFLPTFVEGTDFNTTWGFDRRDKDKLVFKTYYMVDKDGEPTKKWENAVNEYRQSIIINGSKEVKIGEKKDYEGRYRLNSLATGLFPFKFDTDKYHLYVQDKLVESSRFFGKGIQKNVRIETTGASSGNLVEEFLKMTGNDCVRDEHRGFKLYEVVGDPINNTLQLIVRGFAPKKPGKKNGYGKGYVITLDQSLKIAHIQENSSYFAQWSYPNYTEKMLEKRENFRSFGAFPDNYKMNGIDYVYQREIKYAIVTVINLENSQLVLIDDFDSKTTTAIRVAG
ncbi:MAG: hypothetical protein ACI8ZM_002179 [Crocinitomix sp.]|jgi:hypothetical protein